MKFPHALFRRAGLNSTDVAALCGVSRVTGSRWMSGVDRNGNTGVGVNLFLQTKVTVVAKALKLACDRGVLPDVELAKLPPTKREAKLKKIIRDNRV
jgi:hypothetical protein